MPKSAIFIVAQNNFQDQELLVPKDVLAKRGFKTVIAAKTRGQAIGKFGAIVNADLALNEIKAQDFDAVIFVGGHGAYDYFDDLEALKVAQDFQKAGKITAAICAGPTILANAGILIGKTVTGTASQEENIKNRGGDYTGMAVEVDGKVITAKGPDAAQEFGEKLAYLMED